MVKDELFNSKNEVKSSFVKFSKVGDWFKGTFLKRMLVESRLPGHIGEPQYHFELKALAGEFHALDDKKQVISTSIVPEPGTYWKVSGKPSHKSALDDRMRNVKPGQIVGFEFIEEVPSKQKGFNPAKVIKVYAGGMDPSYMGEDADDIDPSSVV